MKLNKMHLFIILASAIVFSVIIGPNLIEGLTTTPAPVNTTTPAPVNTTTPPPVDIITPAPVTMAPVPTLAPLTNTNLLASATNLGDGISTIRSVNNSRNNTFNIDSSLVNDQDNLLNSNNTSDNENIRNNNNRMNRNNNNDNVMETEMENEFEDSEAVRERVTQQDNIASDTMRIPDYVANVDIPDYSNLSKEELIGLSKGEIEPSELDIDIQETKEDQTVEIDRNTLSDGITRDQIPAGQEDRYILKSEIVPPVCPACPPINSCPMREPPPPCPPCARCPKPEFECKKIPIYSSSNKSLPKRMPDPMPVLNDFSKF